LRSSLDTFITSKTSFASVSILPDALRKEGMLTEIKEVLDLIVMTVTLDLRSNARFGVLLAMAMAMAMAAPSNIGSTAQESRSVLFLATETF
jgi:hypothetical protein